MLMPQDVSLPLAVRNAARQPAPPVARLSSLSSWLLTAGITLTIGSDAIPHVRLGLAYVASLVGAGTSKALRTIDTKQS
jgi:hypothetical protein